MSKDTSENNPKPEEKTINSLEFNHMKRVLTVTGITLGTILVFTGIGAYLDTLFNTKPWLMVVGVFISFPFTQILLIKKMKKIADKESK